MKQEWINRSMSNLTERSFRGFSIVEKRCLGVLKTMRQASRVFRREPR